MLVTVGFKGLDHQAKFSIVNKAQPILLSLTENTDR